MPPVIECQNLAKAFVLRSNRQSLLKDRVLSIVRPQLREERQTFWALKDVAFHVERGETFGIIGPNGAGKTTLLRIIAGIFEPTSGSVRVVGRLAPLLALGVGFHPELTGRENIYLNAALFGFTTREIRAVESAIIAFSELGRFIDLPTKNYSSGMQLRLGMSIALEVRPDVFLIDEVLAVGDEHFRVKCLRRLAEERRSGRTFLVASHNLQFVEETCDRAALFIGDELVPGFQRVALPVGPEHAAGGRMNVGDTVRIYVTTNRGKADARTVVGLEQAVVSAVGYQDVGLASSGTGTAENAQRSRGKLVWIEVLVDDAYAGGFLQVLAAGDPDVAVLPPSPTTPTQAGVVR